MTAAIDGDRPAADFVRPSRGATPAAGRCVQGEQGAETAQPRVATINSHSACSRQLLVVERLKQQLALAYGELYALCHGPGSAGSCGDEDAAVADVSAAHIPELEHKLEREQQALDRLLASTGGLDDSVAATAEHAPAESPEEPEATAATVDIAQELADCEAELQGDAFFAEGGSEGADEQQGEQAEDVNDDSESLGDDRSSRWDSCTLQ
jgi:hypothetical protein